MKQLFISVLALVLVAVFSGVCPAADPEPSMYTLDDIYYYLAEGNDEASWGGHSLEPTSGVPGQDIDGFTKSLEDIYYFMADSFGRQTQATYDTIAPNVAQGYYFFCTDTEYWGVQEGTYEEFWLNETTCNELSGWHWYTTNGRSACWSKALVIESVTWNKGVGDDSTVTGSYTPTSLDDYDLQTRMVAAAAGEWYKIVSSVNGTTITSSHNGSAGYSVISALAIADCVDGTKDLEDCTTCSDWSTTNTWLRNWAIEDGKSALPYLGDDAGSLGNNDFESACGQNSGNDLTLGDSCTDNFYLNRETCGDGDTNYSWVAACGSTSGTDWATKVRLMGHYSCSYQEDYITTSSGGRSSFRVVVRPAE